MLDLKEVMSLAGKRVAVLGAGGAARSAVFGARREGADIVIINRDEGKGLNLAFECDGAFQPLSEISHVDADVLINATSVGMAPAADQSPVPAELLSRFPWVVDIIYNPLETKLLRDAAAAGCRVRNGVGHVRPPGSGTGPHLDRAGTTRRGHEAGRPGKAPAMTRGIRPLEAPLDATVSLPGSKSYTQRALVIAALAEGTSVLDNPLLSEDTHHLMEALRSMGTHIDIEENRIIVKGTAGRLRTPSRPLFLGNNGTAIRLLTTMAALGQGVFTLTGDPRLCERPIQPLLKALQALGVTAASRNDAGFPPVVLQSNGIRGGLTVLRDIESSQYISSLLISAPVYAGGAGSGTGRAHPVPPLRDHDPGNDGVIRPEGLVASA